MKKESLFFSLNNIISELEKINKKQQERFVVIPYTTVIWHKFGIKLSNKQLEIFNDMLSQICNMDCDVCLYEQIICEIIYKSY